MTDLLVNELRALRDGCQQARMSSAVDTLDDIILKLNAMIVDRSVRPALEASRRNDLQASRSISTESADLRAMVSRDHQFWQDYVSALTSEAGGVTDTRPVSQASAEQCEAVASFLRTIEKEDVALGISSMSVMTEGYSKKTYLAILNNSSKFPDQLVIRADQGGEGHVPTTVRDEFELLYLLHANGVPVPKPRAIERSGDVLGNAFMVVDKVDGKTVGDPYNAPPRDEALTRSTADAMVRIHSVPIKLLMDAGLGADPAKPHLIADFEKYEKRWKEAGKYCPTVDVAMQWVRNHLELGIGRETLVHNDFSYNNMLVDGSRVTAVLDWEFAHIGNPAADLAYHKYVADQMSGFDFFKQCYVEAGGILPSDDEIDFYYVWGMTRLSVMILEAQSLFDEGRNLDLRFAVAGARYLKHPMLALGATLARLLT